MIYMFTQLTLLGVHIFLIKYSGKALIICYNLFIIVGLYLRHEDWINEFSMAGFDCVCFQSDESLATTSYLFRQRIRRNPVVINVDDVATFDWIEPLQQLVEERDGQEHDSNTIWLKSEKVSYRFL